MTPTDPTPPKASSPQVPAPKASSSEVPAPKDPSRQVSQPDAAHGGHHHDDHLYDQADLENEDVDHEHSDVNVRAILGSGVAMFAVVGVCALIVLGLFNFLEGQAAANDPIMSPLALPAGQLPPEPRLLTDELQNFQVYRDSLAERLKGIDEGKKQLLQQGLPVRADAPADPWMGTHSSSRGEASGGRTIPIRPEAGGETPAAPAVAPVTPAAGTPAPPVKGGGH